MPSADDRFYREIQERFRPRPVHLLIVLDGFGLGTVPEWDAIRAADTPTFDHLFSDLPHTRLMTYGRYVGLPADKDLGGSEVGHMTMGAGRILDQGPTRINRAIADGSFFTSPVLVELVERCVRGKTALHLLGLLSDGNIHSHIDHFAAIIRFAHQKGVPRLYVHALLDGRDVGIQSALDYTDRIEALCAEINQAGGRDYRIASGGGRETITMDRDGDWEKVHIGWEAHVHGVAPEAFGSARAAIESFRARQKGIVDQDLPPFVIVDHGKPVGPMGDGDSVIMVNFRGDRAAQIARAFVEPGFHAFDRGRVPDLAFAGMMTYDEDTNLPPRRIMGPAKVDGPFGKRILELGMRQFRLAETQKFAHVTFFFNGGYRQPLDPKMEDYVLIPSDRGISFDQRPAMKAPEIAAKAEALIRAGKHRFGLINFANTDMVGHTGNFKAAVAATEAVDAALGRIVAALKAVGGTALITADHGNADEMCVRGAKGEVEISTRHSLNPVPAIVYDPAFDGGFALRAPAPDQSIADTPGLSHVTATNLLLLGQPVPEDMARPLIVPPG